MQQGDSFGSGPYAEPNLLLRGVGKARFEEVEPGGGTAEPLVAASRAASFGDIDNDGGVDILVVNRDGPAHLLRNVVPDRGHWILFRILDGHGRDAHNAKLSLRAGARSIVREVLPGSSYLSSNDPRVHIGLGEADAVTGVTVRWMDGNVESFGSFSADQIVEIRRGKGQPLK